MSNNTILLITGANQGLGFELAKKIAAEKANWTIIIGARDLSKGQKAAAAIKDRTDGVELDAVQIDVTSDDSINTAAKELEQKYGRVDVLHNNAGIASSNAKTYRQRMLDVYDVNVAGVVSTIEAFLPLLKKSKSPRIVIMSSDVGSISNVLDPNYINSFFTDYGYKASKAAVNMIGAIASVIYKDHGIRVNMVNPGYTQTGFNGYATAGGSVSDGILEPFRVVTLGDDPATATYTEKEGPIGW